MMKQTLVCNKKAGVSISIVLLVLATLILVISSLFYFHIRADDLTGDISSAVFLEEIYSKEVKLNFYLENVFDKCSENFVSEEEFVNCFIEKIELYGGSDIVVEGLEQIEGQLDEIVFDGRKLGIEFDLLIEEDFEDGLSVSYEYKKSFEAEVCVK